MGKIIKIHLTMCVAESKTLRNYFRMSYWCIESLLNVGFPSSEITVISSNKKYCRSIAKVFPIHVELVGMPDSYKPHTPALYKSFAISEIFPKPVSDSTVMAHVDVDVLFKQHPEQIMKNFKNEFWAVGGANLLRPSRLAKLKSGCINPNLNNREQLTEYLGNISSAVLFQKWNLQKLPKYLPSGGFIAVKPNVYSRFISIWRKMTDYIVETQYARGEQPVLLVAVCAADLLLSFVAKNHPGVRHYPGDRKNARQMKIKAKKRGYDTKNERIFP